MTPEKLEQLKYVAEQFRRIADDRPAVMRLVVSARNTHPHNGEVGDLCGRAEVAVDGDAVRAACDEVLSQTQPKPQSPPKKAATKGQEKKP